MTNGIKYSHNETPIHKDPSSGHSDDPSVYTPTLVDWLHELLGTMHTVDTVRQSRAEHTVRTGDEPFWVEIFFLKSDGGQV